MNAEVERTLKVVEIKMENFYVRKWIKMMNVLWFICHDSFNSRNILEDKLWICCVWKVWSICTNKIYQKKRRVIVRPWAGLGLIGFMINKESQPTLLWCYNMVEETNVPQRVTRRSDMLNESCMLGYVWNALQIAKTK